MKRKPLRSENNNRSSVILIAVFIIGVVIIVLAMLSLVFPYINPFPLLNPQSAGIVKTEQSDAETIQQLNDYMGTRYITVIYPEGRNRIETELQKIQQIPDTRAKLDEIFIWEMKDWIRPNNDVSRFYLVNPARTYAFLKSDPSRMKASPYYDGILYPQKSPDGIMYAEDPYWIAYNKIGECREYSVLFAFMAQQSGIDARLVRTIGHSWVELDLEGNFYYYDPWCADTRGYYNATDGNLTFRDKWFNTIGSFGENCDPPDPYPVTYTTFPYMGATPKYFGASILHRVDDEFATTQFK